MPLIVPPDRKPLPSNLPVVFLAGSIEMGVAEDWQKRVGSAILQANPKVVVANPRRSQWDPSWIQAIENPVFKEQVDWELDHIERANLVVFYFQPQTQSPITLLELGKHLERADAAQSTLVCCPHGFWRKGNVDISCSRKGLESPLESLDELVAEATVRVSAWGA